MQATAAVLRATDAPYQLEEVTLDDPGPGQVAVRIVGVGICHTDHLPRVAPGIRLPLIAGHEGSGVIEAVGPGVTDLAIGDHVVLSFDACGACTNCQSAHPAYCESFFARNMSGYAADGSTNVRDTDGNPIAGRWFGQSSFATHTVVRADNVVKVDPALPLELLGPLGCGVQTGAGAVLNSLHVEAGSSIVVFGAGTVGLSAVMAAAVARAAVIVAVDLNADRLALAAELGATHAVDGAAENLMKGIRRATGGGADYSLDTTGVPKVIGTAIDVLGSRGVCGLVGAQQGDVRINPMQLAVGRTVKGILEGDAVPRMFIPKLIALWREGRFPFDRLIETFPLEKINEAERAALTGQTVKPVLLPAGTSTTPHVMPRRCTMGFIGIDVD